MLARMLAAAKEPPPPPPVDVSQIVVGEVSPFIRDQHAASKRQEAALAMIDDETHAYVLVLLRKDSGATRPEVIISASVAEDAWWPPLVETFHRIGRAALRR